MNPSDELPDLPPIFVDRCLGKGVARRLAEIDGVEVHYHDDHLPQDADDFEWIKYTGERGWIGITHDLAIRNKAIYWEAVRQYNARLFMLRLKRNYNGEILASTVVDALTKMQQFVRDRPPPPQGFLGHSVDLQ